MTETNKCGEWAVQLGYFAFTYILALQGCVFICLPLSL